VVQEELQLLRQHGNQVECLEFDNEGSSASLAWNAPWSKASHDRVQSACRDFRPEIAHVHNFWMRLSPSVHEACGAEGVPTVQTIHNYRLMCVGALLMRDGEVCEDCVGKAPWRGVMRRCYRGSFAPSLAAAAMIMVNRARGTWENDVRTFIAPSRFCAAKLLAAGFDRDKVIVKPHFTMDPGDRFQSPSRSRALLFVGRLSPEKGAETLVKAWIRAGLAEVGSLWIAGDGPQREALEAMRAPGVTFLGSQSASQVRTLMGSARALVVPSTCYETFGRASMEAFSCGRGVVASSLGAIGEAIEDGRTGLTFPAGEVDALGQSLRNVLHEPSAADYYGANARQEYLARYTPEQNYRQLIDTYESAITEHPAERATARLAG